MKKNKKVKTIVELLEELPVGQMIDWRYGLSTRQVERISDKIYEINDTIDGWQKARVKLKTIQDIIDGKKHMLNLNWY